MRSIIYMVSLTTTNAEADLVVEDFILATLKCVLIEYNDSVFVKNHISTDEMIC